MKKHIKLLAIPLLFALITGQAQASYNCAAKRAALEKQLSYARTYGNTYRIAGLERALSRVNAYCNTSSPSVSQIPGTLSDSDISHEEKINKKIAKLERKIQEKETEIAELNVYLSQAQSAGDHKKARKYNKKIYDKKGDILDLRNEIDEVLYDD